MCDCLLVTCSTRSCAIASYVLLRPPTSSYLSIRQHTYPHLCEFRHRLQRQHTSAYVSIRQHTYPQLCELRHRLLYGAARGGGVRELHCTLVPQLTRVCAVVEAYLRQP